MWGLKLSECDSMAIKVCLAGPTGWAGSELARSIARTADLTVVAAGGYGIAFRIAFNHDIELTSHQVCPRLPLWTACGSVDGAQMPYWRPVTNAFYRS